MNTVTWQDLQVRAEYIRQTTCASYSAHVCVFYAQGFEYNPSDAAWEDQAAWSWVDENY